MGSERVDALADPFAFAPAEAADTDVVEGVEASSIKLEMLACTWGEMSAAGDVSWYRLIGGFSTGFGGVFGRPLLHWF